MVKILQTDRQTDRQTRIGVYFKRILDACCKGYFE